MTRTSTGVVALFALSSCTGPPRRTVPINTVSSSVVEMQIGPEALAEFDPVRPAVEEGGECREWERPGVVGMSFTAHFPNRASPEAMVTLAFDDAGEIARYTEIRGVPKPSRSVAEMEAQVAEMDRVFINLDYATGEASVRNMQPGGTGRGVFATVEEFERSATLGDLEARLRRTRELCGVAPARAPFDRDGP